MRRHPAPVVLNCAAAALLILSTGCHVSNHKQGNNDNVDIGTPFGSMHVKTNDNVDASGIGISTYPGATPVHKEKGKDDGAADVNMSFGNFHLGVKAVSFLTPDDASRVLAFYKGDLARYGAVLQCDGKNPIGQPTRTAEGLTCDFDNKHRGKIEWNTTSDSGDGTELRTGSKEHQHIVSIKREGAQTKIGLVALDLPSGLSHHGDDRESE